TGDAGESHVAAVAGAHYRDLSLRRNSRLHQMLCQAGGVVDAVQTLLHIVQMVIGLAVTGRAVDIWRNDCQSFPDQILEHRGKHRSLLSLRASVNLNNNTLAAVVTFALIQPVRNGQSVKGLKMAQRWLYQIILFDALQVSEGHSL